jgi:ribosome-binding protein aMBF1 (putative translation factor)
VLRGRERYDYQVQAIPADIPGSELVSAGLADIEAGRERALADAPARSVGLSRGSFGAAVRELRERRGLSEEQLADATGLHPTLIDPIETGSLAIRLPTILDIAAALEVSAAGLLRLAERIDADERRGDS